MWFGETLPRSHRTAYVDYLSAASDFAYGAGDEEERIRGREPGTYPRREEIMMMIARQ